MVLQETNVPFLVDMMPIDIQLTLPFCVVIMKADNLPRYAFILIVYCFL